MGGVLSFIVGLVGVLNFLNAILTGILARIVPVFALLGITLPLVVYHFSAQKSIVERLREAE